MTEVKKDRITIARLWPRYEGTVSSRAAVISGLDSQRFETIIIYLMKNSEKPNLFEQKGHKVIYLSEKRYFRVFNLPIIWKLAGILRDEKIDILQSHGHLATIYGTIAARIAGVAAVFPHVPGLNRSKRLRRKIANWIVFRWVSKILTTGEAVKEDVLQSNFGLGPQKVISIGNSIDVERFAGVQIDKKRVRESVGLNSGSFVLGTVGRLAPTKGNSYLIEAFAKVKKHIPAAELIFIGNGRLRDELAQQAKALHCADSIHFLGRRDNVDELLKAMDIFVLASVAEGMPRSLLEAMAAGVPCIGTDVGGVGEIIAGEEFGLLVPSKDSQALAKAITTLADMSESERNKISEKAKQRVENLYCHKVVIEKLQNIYRDAMIAKQGFMKYLKNEIDLVEAGSESVSIEKLHVQYNPERFHQYKSLHKGPEEAVLDMRFSPHCRMLQDYDRDRKEFLSDITKNDYYRMQRLFGKRHKSAVSKVTRLIELYESIKTDGFTSEIVVINKPVITNEYNSGYEIYTGHHRVACCINLSIKSVPSVIMETRPKAFAAADI